MMDGRIDEEDGITELRLQQAHCATSILAANQATQPNNTILEELSGSSECVCSHGDSSFTSIGRNEP